MLGVLGAVQGFLSDHPTPKGVSRASLNPTDCLRSPAMSVGLFQSSPQPDRLSVSPEGSLSDVPCHRGIRELLNPQALPRMSCHTLRGQIWGLPTREGLFQSLTGVLAGLSGTCRRGYLWLLSPRGYLSTLSASESISLCHLPWIFPKLHRGCVRGFCSLGVI